MVKMNTRMPELWMDTVNIPVTFFWMLIPPNMGRNLMTPVTSDCPCCSCHHKRSNRRTIRGDAVIKRTDSPVAGGVWVKVSAVPKTWWGETTHRNIGFGSIKGPLFGMYIYIYRRWNLTRFISQLDRCQVHRARCYVEQPWFKRGLSFVSKMR